MWDLCIRSLETARLRGASYADVRVMHQRQRDLTTKNGKVGTLAQSNPLVWGLGFWLNGAWGFTSTDRLTRARAWQLRGAGGGDCQSFGECETT
jgi:TldD protein